MNKLKFTVILIVLAFVGTTNASTKYECNRYVNGEYKGFIKIVADSRSEAEAKAYIKYKDKLKLRVDSVKCK